MDALQKLSQTITQASLALAGLRREKQQLQSELHRMSRELENQPEPQKAAPEESPRIGELESELENLKMELDRTREELAGILESNETLRRDRTVVKKKLEELYQTLDEFRLRP